MRTGLRSRIRLRTRVTTAAFDEQADHWTLTTADGDELTARYVVGATGVLTQPKAPDIAGLERFEGPVLHTARWNDDVALAGRRVAVVGTGASAVQVIPAIAPLTEHLVVFQRTPIWCLPKGDAPLRGRARWLLDHVPGARAVARAASNAFVEITFPLAAHFHGVVPIARVGERVGRSHLRRQVHDRLTPR
jgi:cation diffusion facilitator CzcD-associated flavoprotein CzcO